MDRLRSPRGRSRQSLRRHSRRSRTPSSICRRRSGTSNLAPCNRRPRSSRSSTASSSDRNRNRPGMASRRSRLAAARNFHECTRGQPGTGCRTDRSCSRRCRDRGIGRCTRRCCQRTESGEESPRFRPRSRQPERLQPVRPRPGPRPVHHPLSALRLAHQPLAIRCTSPACRLDRSSRRRRLGRSSHTPC